MIQKAMEAKIRETLIRHHINAEHPGFIAMMGLIAPDVAPDRKWVYPREGEPFITSATEADALCAGDDHSDHPDGKIVESDENNKMTRSWEKLEVVSGDPEIVYDAENGDTVFVRDQDGNAVGEPQYLKPLTKKDLKDEVIARAVGVGIDPPDTNKGNILSLIEKKRLGGGVSKPNRVTIDSSVDELMKAADDLGLIIPGHTPKEEAVKIINEKAKSEG